LIITNEERKETRHELILNDQEEERILPTFISQFMLKNIKKIRDAIKKSEQKKKIFKMDERMF
jgi:bifunctional DNase/RNase